MPHRWGGHSIQFEILKIIFHSYLLIRCKIPSSLNLTMFHKYGAFEIWNDEINAGILLWRQKDGTDKLLILKNLQKFESKFWNSCSFYLLWVSTEMQFHCSRWRFFQFPIRNWILEIKVEWYQLTVHGKDSQLDWQPKIPFSVFWRMTT